ncbi:MAG: ribonuclease P protein component [Tissierellia bacterium]|nr:ribonuclease P protein component [Tissierellia bacterium]
MDEKNRLKKNEDFKKVYKYGKSYYNRNLVMYIKKNGLDYTRVGFTVTKKIGNSVVRNKIRRRIKEIVRQNFISVKEGYDIILVPKKNVVDINFQELESAVFHIFKLAHVFKNQGENNG